ncbi:MAG: hypothetical protein ABIR30_05345 [Chitinophagaceae bacterium]
MKKITGSLALALLIFLASCTGKSEKKEIIVVPAAPVVVVKDPPVKSTTVTLDKNGVKVTTQKVDVIINPDKKKQ